MPATDSLLARQSFDYTSLDAETSLFVQQQTGEIRGLIKRTAEDIIEMGQKLMEVKQRLGHGRFLDWLKAEFDWSYELVSRFINVAKQFKDVKFTDLSIAPSALYVLAAPSTPKAVRQEALARAEAGESITYTTAKAIKQKYATPPQKPKLEPESESEPEPASLPQSGSLLEIVALHRQPQAPTLSEPIFTQTVQAPQVLLPSQPVHAPEKPGIWWRLSGRHLLYCGDPNSSEFLGRITEEVHLLLAFPPSPSWLPAIQATTRIISTKYLLPGRSLDQLDENLESNVLFNSNLGGLVVSCFLPSPKILSVVNRLDRRGLFADPDSRRVNAIISDWKKAGLRVERVS